jgi:glycosyltransferase involved in cell wall biosynthesis
MKIGVDISFLNTLEEKQGVHRYALGFLREITKDKDKKFQIYTNSKIFKDCKKKFKNKNISVILIKNNYLIIKKTLKLFLILFSFFGFYFYKFNSIIINILNKQNKKIIENNSDCIIFLNAHDISYDLRIKKIINFHDLLHERYPNFFSYKELISRKYKYNNSAKYCDTVLASSNYMKDEFLKYFSFLKKKQILIVREGFDKKSFKKTPTKIKKKKSDYFFYPAQLWPHKNHLFLFQTFKKIFDNHKKYKIIFCGSKKKNSSKIFDFIKNNKLEKNIQYLGNISQIRLEKYYQDCLGVLLPSMYESSSLVALESMNYKKPIFTADIPPMKELSKIFRINIFQLKNKKILQNKIIHFIINSKKFNRDATWNYKNLNKASWEYTLSPLKKFINSQFNQIK